MSPAGMPAAGSLAVVARLSLMLLLVAALAGCGYFEDTEPHLAPRTPLLPPTSEALGAPAAVTPTTAAPPTGVAEPPPVAEPDGAATEEPPAAEGAVGEGEPTGDEAEPTDAAGDESEAGSDEAQLLDIVLISELSHDPEAFTQGFEISDGRLYESTGARGDRSSTLRELDRNTGEVLRLHNIEEEIFTEGLTFVDGRIYQLTWKDGVALVWDPEAEDFSEVERFDYEGQGWGLCYNGHVLVMSDGSSDLHFRDPVTFERVGNPVRVTLDGEELPSLNELECVGDRVYANVWLTDLIVQIDTVTGVVRALADASEIGLPRPDDPNAVLNGIAWDPATETFLITGKDWPAIYEIYFEAAGAPNDDPRRLNP